jgi:outer membrane protein TolC
VLAVSVLLTLAFGLQAAHAQEPITIAVVRDGAPAGEDVAKAIEAELGSHTPDAAEIVFKSEPAFDAGWDQAGARRALESALADPETDLVLATGLLTTVAASEIELAKPVVSSFIQRVDLFRLPYSEEDRSLRENLSFVVIPQRALREVETFRSLVGFGTLHVAVDRAELAALGDLRPQILALEAQIDARVEIAEATADVDAFLAGLGPDVEAIYVTYLPRLAEEDRRRLFRGLADRRIATFSAVAHTDVERGALMALSPDNSDQLVRRVALNLARLIRGESTADLPVLMTASTRLLINAETAVAVGYRADRETRTLALFLNPEALQEGADPLSLGEAMRVAEERNITLAIQDSVVESSEQDATIARTILLPQLFADVSHLQTDAALGISSAGLVTDGATRGRLSLQQVIWDDRFRSDYKSAKRLFDSTVENRESVRLDVLADAGRAFFNLALAEALQRVQLDNLRLSEDNLELARLREEVGHSGRDEVLRWEAVVADSRGLLFRANQQVETTRIALNQILNVEQDRRWRPQVIEVEPDVFHFLDGRLEEAFSSYTSLPTTRDAVVEIALENSPEAGAVREVIAAQEIQVKRAKRAWFAPSVFLAGGYATEIDEGSMEIAGFGGDVASFSLNLTYPIFQGGLKGSEIAKAEIDFEGLQRELRLVEQLVEQRTRTALRLVENSFPRVKFALQAARAAAANLVIVQDKYAEGIVNVTDLLSAQTEKFVTDQQAEAAVYEFLIDLVTLQRAIGWFEEEKSAEERAQLADRILAVQMAPEE